MISCGGSQNPVLGRWKLTKTGPGPSTGRCVSAKSIEFFKDGAIVVEDSKVGSYKILDESRVQIEEPKVGAAAWGYKVSGDKLTISVKDTNTNTNEDWVCIFEYIRRSNS